MIADASPDRLQVLMVEDDELDAEIVVLALADFASAVDFVRVEAEPELRNALTSRTWDIVLSDFNLPRFEGFQSLAVARELAPATPFIVVSGAVGEEIAVQLMRAGAADYVMKDNLARLGPAVIREIADAKDRREKLAAEHRFHVMWESSPDAIALLDASDFTWVNVNPAFRTMTGLRDDEIVGQPFDSAAAWSRPEEAVDALEEFRRNRKLRDFEFHLGSRSGADQIAVLSLDNVDLKGRRGLLWIARDETGRNHERARLAREIHDTIAQSLTALNLQLGVARAVVGNSNASSAEELDECARLCKDASTEVRRVIWDLQPTALLGKPIEEALRSVLPAPPIVATLVVEGAPERELDSRVRKVLLRVCQEASSNIRKHARATKVDASLRFGPNEVELAIRDNGIGFSGASSGPRTEDRGGFGLDGMRQRAKLVGGRFRIQGEPGAGTEVKVEVPYEAAQAQPRPRTTRPDRASSQQRGPVAVLIVDDHPVALSGVREILSTSTWIRVVGEAVNGLEGLQFAKRLGPDIVLMDVKMPGLDGISAARRVLELSPRSRVILMSAEARDEQVLQGLKAGARGYLLKDADPATFLQAIRTVLDGGTFLSPSIAARMPDVLPRLFTPELSPRECELLEFMAVGLRNKEIANRLSLTEGTVKWHVSNILQKLRVGTRTEAVHTARARGIIQ